MDSKGGYKNLCTEFYDITKSEPDARELAFYENFLKNRTGNFLEAMCGSGRLLIPLLKKGYTIDGVDNSAAMLASCAKRCEANKVTAHLFTQSMQDLSLPKKYDVIFIAVGSFQLIEDRTEAFSVLQKLHQHLVPGGILLIDTFIPWDCIKPAIKGECFLSPKPHSLFGSKSCFANNFEINLTGVTIIYPQEQLSMSEHRYEKKIDGTVIATDEERLAIRWYYRYEMELFLEKAGFASVIILDESFEHNPQAIVYHATK